MWALSILLAVVLLLHAEAASSAGVEYPPVQKNLFGLYTGESYDNTTGTAVWSDLSWWKNHAVLLRGEMKLVPAANGFAAIAGSTTSGLRFPDRVLPAKYTLFHVARYSTQSGAANFNRIFDGYSSSRPEADFFSGFDHGMSGVAHHNTWTTPQDDFVDGTSRWLLSTDSINSYRAQGLERDVRPDAEGFTPPSLSINHGDYVDRDNQAGTDWEVACVIVYNRVLSLPEVRKVEAWLAARYGITLLSPPIPTPTPTTSQTIDSNTHMQSLQTNPTPLPVTGPCGFEAMPEHGPIKSTSSLASVAVSSTSRNFTVRGIADVATVTVRLDGSRTNLLINIEFARGFAPVNGSTIIKYRFLEGISQPGGVDAFLVGAGSSCDHRADGFTNAIKWGVSTSVVAIWDKPSSVAFYNNGAAVQITTPIQTSTFPAWNTDLGRMCKQQQAGGSVLALRIFNQDTVSTVGRNGSPGGCNDDLSAQDGYMSFTFKCSCGTYAA